MAKIGRNQPCPCRSGKKYKHCHGNNGVNLKNLGHDGWIRQLSVREKNILFINKIGEALQLDSVESEPKSFFEFVNLIKKALTPEAVRNIHLSIADIWPDGEDLDRCMLAEKDSMSGLFIGSYLVDVTANLLNRHALYEKSIILIDPLQDYRVVAPEYNPVEKPEEHIVSTFQSILLWFQLLPWIENGIVKVIRDPGDFNYQLRKTTLDISKNRSEKSRELIEALAKHEMSDDYKDLFRDQFALSQPDEYWIDKVKDDDISEDEARQWLQDKRARSLHYVDVGQQSQMLKYSTGTNYEMGKYICGKTDSHIITDLSYRWKEMEYDRKENGVHIDEWSPFSKAIQSSELKHLNGLSFNDLLKLREDGYLEDMRVFLRRVWSSCSSGDSFDKNNIENLSAEMTEQINIAEAEWKEIDANLIKWFGSESIFGAAIGVSAASVGWVPAVAVAAAGAVNLGQAYLARNSFISRYPAAFLLDSIRNKT